MPHISTRDKAFLVLQPITVSGIGEAINWLEIIDTYLIIRRLALKHQRLAAMSCNGQGVIRGQAYYNGTIDDYARRTYGQGVKSAYVGGQYMTDTSGKSYWVDGEDTVFDVESDKAADKIMALCKKIGFDVEFQGDPRGATVKLAYKGRNVEIF